MMTVIEVLFGILGVLALACLCVIFVLMLVLLIVGCVVVISTIWTDCRQPLDNDELDDYLYNFSEGEDCED